MATKERFGPIYRPQDYPGVFKRMAVDLVDFAAVGIGAVALVAALEAGLRGRAASAACLAFLIAAMAYLGPYKATGLPTLGYLVFGVKVTDMEGRRISLWQATSRLAFMLAGPVNILVDFFWMYNGPLRQTLRDKLCGTVVVEKDAVKVADGRVVFKVVHGMGYRLICEEVEFPASESIPAWKDYSPCLSPSPSSGVAPWEPPTISPS
jgi:uncharacterized RDD family membrane protein YckC